MKIKHYRLRGRQWTVIKHESTSGRCIVEPKDILKDTAKADLNYLDGESALMKMTYLNKKSEKMQTTCYLLHGVRVDKEVFLEYLTNNVLFETISVTSKTEEHGNPGFDNGSQAE